MPLSIQSSILSFLKLVCVIVLSVLCGVWITGRKNDAEFTYNEVKVEKVQAIKEPKKKKK